MLILQKKPADSPNSDSNECKEDLADACPSKHGKQTIVTVNMPGVEERERDFMHSRTVSRRSKKIIHKFHNPNLRPALRKYKPSEDYPDLSNNSTILAKVLTPELYGRLRDLTTSGGATLDAAIQPGLDSAKAFGSGVLLGDIDSYEMLAPLLDYILSSEGFPKHYIQKQNTCLPLGKYTHIPGVSKCYIRVDRSVTGYPFAPLISRAQRRQLHKNLKDVCENALVGNYISFEEMHETELDEWRFKFNMLESSPTCRRDEPDHRGVFLGRDDEFSEETDYSVWLNETEHCSIIATDKKGNLKGLFERVFDTLNQMRQQLQEKSLDFAYDKHFGYLTCDPLSSGTGITISVEVSLPKLSHHLQFKHILKNLRLQSEVVNESTILISNQHRHGLSEADIFTMFAAAVTELLRIEKRFKEGKKFLLPKRIIVPWNEKATDLRMRLSQFVEKRENLGPAPLSLLVTGREGMNNIINGIYVKCAEHFNARPAYEKVSTRRTVYLRWHAAGYWIFDDELRNDLEGFAFSKTDAVYPLGSDIKWHVYCRATFAEDAEIKVVPHGKGNRFIAFDEQIRGCRKRIMDYPHKSQIHFPELRSLSMAATFRMIRSRSEEHFAECAPNSIVVDGENPCSFFINGTYSKAESLHEGRAYWRKSDDGYSAVMRWHPKGLWIISDFLSTKLKGFALVHDYRAKDPTKVQRTWKVMSKGKYVKNPKISVIDAIATEI